MRKTSHPTRFSTAAVALLSAITACVAPAAHAQSAPSPQVIAAQFLPLGASAADAFKDSSTGSALAQITRAQGGQPATTAPETPAVAPPALIDAKYVHVPLAAAPQPEFPVGADPSVFGTIALAVSQTGLDWRWRRIADAPPPDDARWREAVLAFSALPERARLEAVNAWVNRAVSFESDLQNYGVSDYWASARETLVRGRGDCEDYAIAKMALLRAAGTPVEDLYLLVAHDLVRRADHALLLVRMDDGFWVLDSGSDRVSPARQVRDYRPVVTFSSTGEWMHGYRQTPGMTYASAARLTPASGFRRAAGMSMASAVRVTRYSER